MAALALATLTACGGSASENDFAKAAGDNPTQTDVNQSTAAPDTVGAGVGADNTAAIPPVAGATAAPAGTAPEGAGGSGLKATAPAASTGGASNGTKAGSAAGGAKDTSTIQLGAVCDCSGPAGSSEGPPMDALRAWVQWTNLKGGLNGHPVNVTVVDDRSDPSRARAATQDLVENKGVVAMLAPFATLTHSGIGPYLKAKRVPLIGGDGNSPEYVTNPMYFPIGPSQQGWGWGALKVMADQYKERKLGVMYCVEAQTCSIINDTVQKEAAGLGYKVVYTGQTSIASPDFTAQCLAAKAAGVDALLVAMDLNSMRRLAPQCARQGFTPKYGGMQQDATYLQIPQYQGFPYANQVFPYVYNGPEAAEFHAAMARFLPNGAISPFFANVWVAGQFFKQAVSKITGPVTSAAILDQLWTFKNFTAGGLSIPMTYTRDQPTVPPYCVYLTVVAASKIEAPLGLKTMCK